MKFLKVITERGPVGWVRRLLSVVSTYHKNIQIMAAHVDEMENTVRTIERYVKRATKAHIDVDVFGKSPCSNVVVIGKYRGRDYVRTFNVKHGSLDELVKWLSGMEKHAQLGRIDAPMMVDATIKRGLKKVGTPLDGNIF